MPSPEPRTDWLVKFGVRNGDLSKVVAAVNDAVLTMPDVSLPLLRDCQRLLARIIEDASSGGAIRRAAAQAALIHKLGKGARK